MTTSRSKRVLVAALCLLVAACGRLSSPDDLPPGVSERDWIRISDVAGIVLTNVGAPIPVTGPAGERLALPVPLQVTGVLMVKLRGVWTRAELELPGARVHPLL